MNIRSKLGSSGIGRVARSRWFVALFVVSQVSFPSEPTVRIGLDRNVTSISITSSTPFRVEGVITRRAEFSLIVTIGQGEGPFVREDLETRMAIQTDGDTLLVRPLAKRIRIVPGGAALRVNDQSFRGDLEVFGSPSGRLTLVNELLLEDYLLGVVPNELGPDTFPEIEALRAQSIAARTYIVRNLGQFEDEGFDICDTEFCQVYRGLDTEHPLATQAVELTRGQVATYDGAPINALYSSTCGGRTEDAGNVFGTSVPYLVSTVCHYDHPDPQRFATATQYSSWEEGLLGIAGVADFADAARFLGIRSVNSSPGTQQDELAEFIKQHFFPDIPAESSRRFLEEQGILPVTGDAPIRDVLLRLLLRKNGFEWQEARLIRWDGETLEVRIGSEVQHLGLAADAAIFKRIGDERIPVNEGSWVGGESMELRIVDGQVEAMVYRPGQTNPTADRYSPLAAWQVHRNRSELDAAIRPLNIGGLEDIVVLERGPSNRVLRADVQGTEGSRVMEGSGLRTLLGLRDTMVFIDDERNVRGQLLGMSLFGRGWGHGVGLCQVGAYGMAIDGASAEDILKTYYRGIEIERVY